MKLSRAAKIALGIITFLPFILGTILAIILLSNGVEAIREGTAEGMTDFVLLNLGMFLGLTSFMAILSIAIFIIYLIHVLKNEHLSDVMKLIWIILQIFFNPVAHIVYYFMEVLPEHKNRTIAKGYDYDVKV